jgi:LCP family protein required for cell wall assembly
MIYDDQNKLIPKKQKGIKKILTQVVEGIKNVAVFIGRGIKEISIRIKGMNKWAKIIISLVVIIMILTAILVSKFVGDRLSKIHFKDLDEGNLGINTEVYSEIEGLTKKEYDQVVNILLLGSDSKDMSEQYDGNSDAIMIISINPKFKSIKLISIPRDTAANIAGFENRYKINAAFATGKEQLAVKTINENFGLNIKEYVTVNISSMYDVINEIGGVELEITKEEMNSINHFVDMFYQFSGKPTKKVTSYGKVTLTGEQAAAHVKEREAGYRSGTTDYGDFGRTRRQREVLVAMLNKILTKDLGEISRIIDLILEQVTTNINVGKYMGMLPELVANKDAYLNNLTSVMIPKNEYSEEILENGTFLYVTDLEKAKKDFIHYMYEM